MVVTTGIGQSMVMSNRRFDSYESLKQHLKYSTIKEVMITGRTTTDGALKEIHFSGSDIINYIAAEGQVYLRTELDDATQHGKYVSIEYHDDTGAIKIATGLMDAANSTTETAIAGVTDFFRLRQMVAEVAAVATKGIILTDAAMGGADDIFGFIEDTESKFNLQRFFVQPAATCTSYLGRLHMHTTPKAIGAATDSYMFSVTYTPKVVTLEAGYPQKAAEIEEVFLFEREFDWHPCLVLEPGTEVTFKVGAEATDNVIHMMAIMIEDYSLGKK